MSVYATGCDLNRSWTLAPVCAPSARHEPGGSSSLSSDDEEDNECKEQMQDWKGRHRAQRLKWAQNDVLWGAHSKIRIPSGVTVWDYHVCWCKSVCERVFGTSLQARCRIVFLWASGDVKSALAPLTNTISTSHHYQQHVHDHSSFLNNNTSAVMTRTSEGYSIATLSQRNAITHQESVFIYRLLIWKLLKTLWWLRAETKYKIILDKKQIYLNIRNVALATNWNKIS